MAGTSGPKENERGLSVITASYGIQGNFIDVTSEVQGLVQDGELNFTVSPQQLGILDPAPGVTKELQIQYKINKGKKNLLTMQDTQQVILSAPNVPKEKNEDSYTYVIFKALWYSVIIFLVGAFAMDSKRTGDLVFGSAALGWLFAVLTVSTIGHFYLFLLPLIVIFIAWWSS